jgi:hypothetical protein
MAISSTDVFDHDVHRYRTWFVALGAAPPGNCRRGVVSCDDLCFNVALGQHLVAGRHRAHGCRIQRTRLDRLTAARPLRRTLPCGGRLDVQAPDCCGAGADASVFGLAPRRWTIPSDRIALVPVPTLGVGRVERCRQRRPGFDAVEFVAGIRFVVHRILRWHRPDRRRRWMDRIFLRDGERALEAETLGAATRSAGRCRACLQVESH